LGSMIAKKKIQGKPRGNERPRQNLNACAWEKTRGLKEKSVEAEAELGINGGAQNLKKEDLRQKGWRRSKDLAEARRATVQGLTVREA